MGALDGRVAIVTGAGRGLGREHALLLAAEGARVVVNDLGGEVTGEGADLTPAHDVAAQITRAGGEAVVNGDDVSDWDGAQRLIDTAVHEFGRLDVLVNNAGIVRDRMLVNMTEADWDAVIGVHLKGHFAPTRWAFAHWRERSKAGDDVQASVVNTSSISAMTGNFGQAHYGAAKAGIASFTMTAALEGANYGIRVNAIAPVARTRLTTAAGDSDVLNSTRDLAFDVFDPANVSPLVAYLATAECPVTGNVFHVGGREVGVFGGWELMRTVEAEGRWNVDALRDAVPALCGERVTEGAARIDVSSFIGEMAKGREPGVSVTTP